MSEEFINELYADWCEHGSGVLEIVRETRPEVYLRVVASLLPRVHGADETNPVQVHHTIRRIIVQEGELIASPVLELEAVDVQDE